MKAHTASSKTKCRPRPADVNPPIRRQSGGRKSPALPGDPPAGRAQISKAAEWWFVQGRYKRRSRTVSFLLAFFRVNLARKNAPPRPGFTLLASSLDEKTLRQDARSWVDGAVMDKAIKLLDKPNPALDELYRQAIRDELAAGLPPAPVEKITRRVRFREDPFSISWGGYALAYGRDGSLNIRFQEQHGRKPVNLRLRPAVPYQDVLAGPGSAKASRTMAYRVCTRMMISGRSASGAEITGDAWFEHQSMTSHWLCSQTGEKDAPTAWMWFGVRLDKGDDLLIFLMWDCRTGGRRLCRAMRLSSEGPRRDAQDVEVETLRNWRSPATFISYPVETLIRIRPLGVELRFRPLADDQELHTFGPSRAVWEGAGEVEGYVDGGPARGRARAEFHGYGYILDYDGFISEVTGSVDDALKAFLPDRFDDASAARFIGPPARRHDPEGLTEMISVPVWDLLRRKGKRWRPLFGHFLLRALGGDGSRFDATISLNSELLHSGALIIDDIEDGSLLRRGEPCIHLRYGTDVAINAGTALFFIPALDLMNRKDLSPGQRIRLHEIKERVCIEAHFGQALDLYWTRGLTRDRLDRWMADGIEERILQMYDLKTGAGTRGVASAAAVLAGADREVEALCIEFARAYAVAFQIVDDVHNFSRSPAWTKIAGEDLANGKPTYVIVQALRRLSGLRRSRLADLLCDPVRRAGPAGREEGMALVRGSGALAFCRAEALRLTDEGWAPMARRLPPTEAKILLRAMCRKVLQFIYEG